MGFVTSPLTDCGGPGARALVRPREARGGFPKDRYLIMELLLENKWALVHMSGCPQLLAHYTCTRARAKTCLKFPIC